LAEYEPFSFEKRPNGKERKVRGTNPEAEALAEALAEKKKEKEEGRLAKARSMCSKMGCGSEPWQGEDHAEKCPNRPKPPPFRPSGPATQLIDKGNPEVGKPMPDFRKIQADFDQELKLRKAAVRKSIEDGRGKMKPLNLEASYLQPKKDPPPKPEPSFKPTINGVITKAEFVRRQQEDEARLQAGRAALKAKLNKTAAPDLSNKAWAQPKKPPPAFHTMNPKPSFKPALGPSFDKGKMAEKQTEFSSTMQKKMDEMNASFAAETAKAMEVKAFNAAEDAMEKAAAAKLKVKADRSKTVAQLAMEEEERKREREANLAKLRQDKDDFANSRPGFGGGATQGVIEPGQCLRSCEGDNHDHLCPNKTGYKERKEEEEKREIQNEKRAAKKAKEKAEKEAQNERVRQERIASEKKGKEDKERKRIRDIYHKQQQQGRGGQQEGQHSRTARGPECLNSCVGDHHDAMCPVGDALREKARADYKAKKKRGPSQGELMSQRLQAQIDGVDALVGGSPGQTKKKKKALVVGAEEFGEAGEGRDSSVEVIVSFNLKATEEEALTPSLREYLTGELTKWLKLEAGQVTLRRAASGSIHNPADEGFGTIHVTVDLREVPDSTQFRQASTSLYKRVSQLEGKTTTRKSMPCEVTEAEMTGGGVEPLPGMLTPGPKSRPEVDFPSQLQSYNESDVVRFMAMWSSAERETWKGIDGDTLHGMSLVKIRELAGGLDAMEALRVYAAVQSKLWCEKKKKKMNGLVKPSEMEVLDTGGVGGWSEAEVLSSFVAKLEIEVKASIHLSARFKTWGVDGGLLMWMVHASPPGTNAAEGLEGGKDIWKFLGITAKAHLVAIGKGFGRAMGGESISDKGESVEQGQARRAKQKADIKQKSEEAKKQNQTENDAVYDEASRKAKALQQEVREEQLRKEAAAAGGEKAKAEHTPLVRKKTPLVEFLEAYPPSEVMEAYEDALKGGADPALSAISVCSSHFHETTSDDYDGGGTIAVVDACCIQLLGMNDGGASYSKALTAASIATLDPGNGDRQGIDAVAVDSLMSVTRDLMRPQRNDLPERRLLMVKATDFYEMTAAEASHHPESLTAEKREALRKKTAGKREKLGRDLHEAWKAGAEIYIPVFHPDRVEPHWTLIMIPKRRAADTSIRVEYYDSRGGKDALKWEPDAKAALRSVLPTELAMDWDPYKAGHQTEGLGCGVYIWIYAAHMASDATAKTKPPTENAVHGDNLCFANYAELTPSFVATMQKRLFWAYSQLPVAKSAVAKGGGAQGRERVPAT